MPFKSGIKCGFKWALRAYTLSPHFVSTLGRLRFVPALYPYALSHAKAGAAEVYQTRPIVLVLVLETTGTTGTADGYRWASTGSTGSLGQTAACSGSGLYAAFPCATLLLYHSTNYATVSASG